MNIFNKKPKANSSKIVIGEKGIKIGSGGYTRLRDNIIYLNATGNHKVIQVESAVPHEGKTTLVANLAVSLGYTDKKVLVLDLDLRRPRAHRLFGLKKEIGLADYILSTATKEQIIKKTEYKNVDIITRGAEVTNPSLILVSEKFKNFVEELRDEYDYIIIDCAPILQVSDYIHISKVSDGILFLTAFGRTAKIQVSEAIAELQKNDIKVLGSVFTMYDKKKDKGYGYYGKYYSYDYEDNEN